MRLLLPLLLACGGDDPKPAPTDTAVATDTAASTGSTTTTAESCAHPALPAGLDTVAYDDGVGTYTIHDIAWEYTGAEGTFDTLKELQWEAVRFELPHPARIHGYSVQWTNLKDDLAPTDPLTVGLFPDFGYNGFDFDQWTPYAQVDRCVADHVEGEWLDYVLPSPVEILHPGLVFVAQQKTRKKDPVFMLDEGAASADCLGWGDCPSAWNFPELDDSLYYNGISLMLPYDYLVRLHVEWLDDVQPEAYLFQPAGFTASSRVSWGDYDNDGWEDVLTNGPRLWRNQGDGTFVDVSAEAGLELGVGVGGGVWGDFDNDGCLDLFGFSESVTGGGELLLRNTCDGQFIDVTAASGIVDDQSDVDCSADVELETANTSAAAWIDIDADGLIDLYMSNMICWDLYQYYTDRVWHNEGDGTFTDWTGINGFSTSRLSGRGASPADADNDGDVDLMVNNYTLHRNLFFDNQGDGTVVERAGAAGLAGDEVDRYYGHTIGAAWGDVNGDGWLDAVHGNLAHPRFYEFSDRSKVLLNGQDGTFTEVDAGLRYQETHSVPALGDLDHDGDLDLVLTAVYDGRPTDLYWGVGDGTFILDSYHAGITTTNGWGVGLADYDRDGDLDVLATSLFDNQAADGSWFQVRAVGNVRSNRAAIGAMVRVTAGDTTWVRHVNGGTGQGNQDSLVTHFGLGDAASVDRIEVTFPGQPPQVFAGPFAVDRRWWVYEDGSVAEGWHNDP
ncbi:MAG: hypothetical protein ACI9K2_006163 [Myxococcota bacterium]|jgi:hypothetical protein